MAAGIEAGLVEIEASNSAGQKAQLFHGRTEVTSASKTDPRLWAQISSPIRVQGGSKVSIYFTSDATDTLDSTDMMWSIQGTLKDLRTGHVQHKNFGLADFNASDVSGKDAFANKVCTAAVRTQVGELVVPANAELMLNGAAYIDFYDDTA